MTSNADLAMTSATDLADLVRLKKVSPVELVDVYASRIEEFNPRLDAYLTLCLDRARDEARRAAQAVNGDDLPPFHGVPISIKDLSDTEGVRTTHGTAAFADRIPDRDSEMVARIRRAGFIVLGKTNTPEFGTTPWTEPEAYPPARNPWDPERTPGGSSGGAAAALAAGLCPISQGSDGGGSVRIPASCCGVYGIKPSRGRVSGAPGPQSFLSQVGPLSRTVADAAAMLDAIAGYATGDAFWAAPPERPFLEEASREPGRLRVAVSTTPGTADTHVDAANRQAVADTAALLAELGHDVTEDAPPPWPEHLTEDFLLVWCVRTAAYQPMPPYEQVGALNRALIDAGRGYTGPDFEMAQQRIQRESRGLVTFFDDYDVLVTPTVAITPPKVGEYFDPDNPLAEFMAAANFVPFTPPWNTTGQPAVSVPSGSDDLGMPVGVQIVGRPNDEATLIRLSAQIEGARPWAHHRPPVS